MNLVKELILSSPVGNHLKFGYHGNIIISKLDTGVKLIKGLPIKQNTFITFAEIDPKTNKVIAQSEGAYWNLDHTTDFVVQNFIDQYTSISAIISAAGGDAEAFDTEVLKSIPEEYDDVDAYVKTKAGAVAMQDVLVKGAEKYLRPFVGDTTKLYQCKVVTNKKGFFEPGKELYWILPMDSEEKLAAISAAERKAYRASLTADDNDKVEPDSTDSPTAEKSIASLNALNGL